MNSNEETNLLKQRWHAALDSYREDYRRAAHRRNVAAITDFTKNLFSLVAQNKGMRYNVAGKPHSGSANKAYEEAQKRYRSALVDYEGKIAALKLKEMAGAQAGNNMPAVATTSRPQFITPHDITFRKPFPSFGLQSSKPSSSTLDAASKKYSNWYSHKKQK